MEGKCIYRALVIESYSWCCAGFYNAWLPISCYMACIKSPPIIHTPVNLSLNGPSIWYVVCTGRVLRKRLAFFSPKRSYSLGSTSGTVILYLEVWDLDIVDVFLLCFSAIVQNHRYRHRAEGAGCFSLTVLLFAFVIYSVSHRTSIHLPTPGSPRGARFDRKVVYSKIRLIIPRS